MTGPRIGFAGAGGVGCYFGGQMALAGFDVTLIGRGDHIQKIGSRGLQLTLDGTRHKVELFAADTRDPVSLAQLQNLDWLFVTCKSYQTADLIKTIAPHLGAETRIISLQNGVDGPIHLSKLLNRPVYGGLSIRFVSHVVGPGEVIADGAGYIQMGTYPNGVDAEMSALGHELTAAGLDVRVTDDINRELWRKIIINNGVNPICALLQQDCGEIFSNAGTAHLVDQMMQETVLAARADDIVLSVADVEELRGIIFGLGHVKPSMQVDREQGRALELDAISGAILDRVARLGECAPVTETIHNLLVAAIKADQRARS